MKRIRNSILRLPIEKRTEIALREAVKGVIEEHACLGLPLYIAARAKSWSCLQLRCVLSRDSVAASRFLL